MREITVVDALNEALREEMRRDDNVILLGEDIGKFWQGAFKVTRGLEEEFGPERVRDTPISENATIGCAVGAAMTGLRPVAEIMFGDLVALAMDQICNQAAKLRYMSGGQVKVPIVVRTPFGAGGSYASHHSQSLEAWFIHVPGLKVVQPSNAYDAKGLLKSAIRDDNPVVFCEHKFVYGLKGKIPEEEYTIPLGKARVMREGDDITVIATSLMVPRALKAAEELKNEISCEVIDPRTLRPLDGETLCRSAKKTGKVLIVHESCDTGGISGEITKTLVRGAFYYLDNLKILAGKDAPIPFAPVMEKWVAPDEERIKNAVKEIVL
ncbi:MAG: alpha-ketoacid dehydrogenase subunit beta [Theionarchaea archaeon]|nr:alpha-ketoacid dehydrogenase subunit beta [Theionarchaea archaeon]